ncbi:ATP-dependent DNA helicase RecG [Permianibacter sp. IMCC34836]|uniref:ATP-dependent DNA helicase RecG n=1 Tax=Permianibacter fluminis TaxID=2738515 RepID=UPI0015561F1C|nr:ATP-dependent DNA helicase RecG [Permianibacter fluminis]NQD36442.1 ATP-dependent DNA helicase RecG [Permianibacter fluminis]
MSAPPATPTKAGSAVPEQQAVTTLSGVGPALAQKLERLGIRTLADLLFHLPLRYEDRTRLSKIAELSPREPAQIEGEILGAEIAFGRRRSLVARLRDDSGEMELRFFHFNKAQQDRLQFGGRVRVYGEARYGRRSMEIVHPELRWLKDDEVVALGERLTPVYPITEGLSQQSLRKLVQQALQKLANHEIVDLLPADLLREQRLPSLTLALRTVHQPPADIDTLALISGEHPAIVRLVLEELIANQLTFLRLREKARAQAATALPAEQTLTRKLLQALPFSLTGAQTKVLKEIRSDLQQPRPMLRLVQGDVGSGKTLVAAFAALNALGAGKQAAVMAPTELLAEQHLLNFSRWFEPLGIRCVFLAGRIKGKARDSVLADIRSGDAAFVVGTHALFQEGVVFKDLALVVIDEQHRFGVHQRLQLWEKGRSDDSQGPHRMPHQLVMTATPIPRTLAMTAYADLDNSIIDELPPGRTPVTTVVIPDNRRDEVIDRVRAASAEGRQVYWVCTLIEESELLQAQAAEATYDLLREQLAPLRIALVHGRMKPAEKQAVMQAFKAHETDVLVATTVIEVGVDVPNASLMIIENAERLGLAQLHQLRGRVGRGSAQSHCVLMYHGALSAMAKERLAVMRDSNDGFVIAEKDMELRGPGELLGTRQTGIMAFKIADIARDQKRVALAQQLARELLARHPQQVPPLIARWLAGREGYGQV